jgi:hypothetical protein
MDDRTLARWRLHTLALAGERYPSPVAVVDGLLAVQAENFRQAAWAVASRAEPLVDEAAFRRLCDDGVILRTHVLRPTWHFVTPADIRWLLELTAPRVRRTFEAHQRDLGLSDAVLERATAVIIDALAHGAHRTRAQLAERLAGAGLPAAGPEVGLYLAGAEWAGLVCSGALAGNQQTYALLAERAPTARRLDRDAALAEIVLRYFRGHGPATERDLSYWATLTLGDVRAGLDAVAGELDNFAHDGRTYWYAQPPPGDGDLVPRAHLLLVLDEYHNGYQDSRHVLDAEGLVPRSRAATYGMALVDGQMVGDMRRTIARGRVRFDVGLFRTLDAAERAALVEAGERAGHFLGLAASVVLRPPGG